MPIIAIAILIAAALGGGVSAMAQTSLPGEPLWGFKTTVNEGVAGALSFGDEAKANWDISATEARLNEAKTLQAQGKLNAKAQADIEANIDEHAQDVADLVAKLQAKGNTTAAAAVATHFQASLARSADSVSAGLSAEAQAGAQPLLTAVRGTLDAAANLSSSASAQAEHEDATTTDNERDGSDDSGANAEVHTGTSVRGGEGGIQTDSQTGVQVGI
jgi:hypothetical protein